MRGSLLTTARGDVRATCVCDSDAACHRSSQVLTKPAGTLPFTTTKEEGKALHGHGIGLLIYLLGVCFFFFRVFIYRATCEVPPDWGNDGRWGRGRGRGRGKLLHQKVIFTCIPWKSPPKNGYGHRAKNTRQQSLICLVSTVEALGI